MWRHRLKYEGAEDYKTREPPYNYHDAMMAYRNQAHHVDEAAYLDADWEGEKAKGNTKGPCTAQKTGNVVDRDRFFDAYDELVHAMALTAAPAVSIFAT